MLKRPAKSTVTRLGVYIYRIMHNIIYCFSITMLFLLLTACGGNQQQQEVDTGTNSLPQGWEVVPDRHNYLAFYESNVNDHPRISMPLQMVYEQNGTPSHVYRGIVVGEKASKAGQAILVHRGKDNCDTINATAANATDISCITSDSVKVFYLLHDASPTATYIYAIIDSTYQDGYDAKQILHSFISTSALNDAE